MVGSVFRPQINSSPQSATSFTVSNPTGQSATVRIATTAVCYLSMTGAATTNDMPLYANAPELFLVQNNDILYFSNPSAGSVYISWDGGEGL